VVRVKLRSAQPAMEARIEVGADGRAEVALTEPAEGIAPGQACVVYDGDRVLGGGWIQSTADSRSAGRQAA
jgi:tRNA-specific 2-thiouridylase